MFGTIHVVDIINTLMKSYVNKRKILMKTNTGRRHEPRDRRPK